MKTVRAVAGLVRRTVTPAEMPAVVDHYSIPALDETGGPRTEAAAEIDSAKSHLTGGEVIISRLNPRKSRVYAIPEHLPRFTVASTEFVVLEPHAVDARFLAYVLRSERHRQELDSRTRSATRSHQRVDPSAIAALAVLDEPVDEERRIADFLDAQVSRVDRIIAARHEQARALRDAFAELVERLVRDPRASATPIRRLADVRTSSVDKVTADGEVPVTLCNYTDVYYHRRIRPGPGLMRATASPSQVRQFCLRPGDTVLTKDSETAADIGIPCYVEASADDFVCGYHLAIVRPREGSIDPEYLYWCLASRGVRRQLATRANGVTRFGLTLDALKSSTLAPLPRREQADVARELSTRADELARTTEAYERSVGLLAEYQRSLVTATVSGELDVTTASGRGAPG